MLAAGANTSALGAAGNYPEKTQAIGAGQRVRSASPILFADSDVA